MISPFKNTYLYTTISLHPSQLNNDIYVNLKQNVIKKLEKKCYKNYGYVNKVYDINEYSNGMIVPEDPDAAPLFNVKVSCNLCNPVKNTQIICKFRQSSEVIISLSLDPIHIIVTPERINSEKFHLDLIDHKIRRLDNSPLTTGDYVKSTILAPNYIDKDVRIMALGTLDDVATDDEVKQFYEDLYAEKK
jgi:DNA-directed RNA polymerase subunit E'/Rpb7